MGCDIQPMKGDHVTKSNHQYLKSVAVKLLVQKHSQQSTVHIQKLQQATK